MRARGWALGSVVAAALWAAPGGVSAQQAGDDAASGPRNVLPWLNRALDGDAAGSPDAGSSTPPGPPPPRESSSRPAPLDLDLDSVRTQPLRADDVGDERLRNGQLDATRSTPAGDAVGPPPLGASNRLRLETPTEAERRRTPLANDPATRVDVAPLDAISDASAGLTSASDVGLPADAWRGATEAEAAALIARVRPTPLHAANQFAVRLLSAAIEAPIDAGFAAAADGEATADLFTARLAALTRFGALDQAARLAEIAGDPLHPLAVDAALLAGRAPALCDALFQREAAGGVETLPSQLALTRIYCLTLVDDAGGAGAGATLAIGAARALGEADAVTLDLLEAAADPGLAEFVEAPSDISEMTPLRIAAMRGAGKSPPADYARGAPLSALAFFGDDESPRAQLETLERLEASGAIETEILERAYSGSQSAESGGVWGRVETWRGALQSSSPDTIRSFRLALGRARDAGREDGMARLLAGALAERAAAGAPMRDASLRRALRLGGRGDAASALLTPDERRAAGPEERALDRIAAPNWTGPWDVSDLNPLLARAARGDRRAGQLMAALTAFGAPTSSPGLFEAPPEIIFAAEDGRFAALAFEALALLSSGGADRPDDLHAALSMLIAAGQPDVARQVAVEAILIGG